MTASRPAHPPYERERGAALILVMVLTVGIAMLALSALVLASSGTLLTRHYETEREFRYAVEATLAMGKARLGRDTSLVLPDSGFVTLLSNAGVLDAAGDPLPAIRVSLYAGLSGNTSGQGGTYVSLLAQARDVAGATRYVRGLELAAESFARYAMFTNHWPSGCYATGDVLRGPGHSNESWRSCGTPVYVDTITAALDVAGGTPEFRKGSRSNVPVIPLPSAARLANLHGHAVSGHMDVDAMGASLASARTRIEFVAVDLNDDGDVIDAEEGFFRVFQANDPDRARARYVGAVPDEQCGDWHDVDGGPAVKLEFFPVAVHDDAWYAALGFADAGGGVIDAARRHSIMSNALARCFPAGDPHLVAVERAGVAGYLPADWERGGSDTTFTAAGSGGRWVPFPGAAPWILSSIPNVRQSSEAAYLWPLHRTLNPGSKGVIHAHGSVLLSGVLRSRVTLYANGDVGFVDDLTYAQDPAAALCANLLGVIAGGNAMILDNGINSPQRPLLTHLWTDDNQDWIFHGVIMSLTGTVGVENWNLHPESMKLCNGTMTGRGCILQVGGVIQDRISETSNAAGSGFAESRGVDQCLQTDSPPYFPATSRYTDSRYFEVDPARFTPGELFQKLQGDL